MFVYVNRAAYAEHLALVKGDISGPAPVLVRMHALSVFRDVLGDSVDAHIGELQKAMDIIGEAGRGVVVLIREPWMTSLSDKMREREEEPRERPCRRAARLRRRRADPARSRRARYDPAVQQQSAHRRARGLWAQGRGTATDSKGRGMNV